MTTLAEALDAATGRLREADIESPRLDARLLLEWACGLDTATLIGSPDREPDRDALTRFERAIAQRSAGRPVARIVGEKEFWGLSIRLNDEALVPRPDTETVVEAVLDTIGSERQDWRGSICDLGTGSGAILIALLSELPMAEGTGVDISEAAIECAKQNAARHGLAERTRWIAGDYAVVPDTRHDVIVCNPPYVTRQEIAGLSREVRDHDPRRALDGGQDGLDAYRTLAVRLSDLLSENGLAALELGSGQDEAVSQLMISGGLSVESIRPDLAGIPRVLVCAMP